MAMTSNNMDQVDTVTTTDSEMTNVADPEIGGDSDQKTKAGDRADIREVVVVLDKWSRTCDIILKSLDEQIARISKRAVN